MRLFFLVFFLTFIGVKGQQQIETLKKTLFEAEKRYGVTFTFDDVLISQNRSYEEQLPETLAQFQELLVLEYGLTSVEEEKSIILSDSQQANRVVCGYLKSDLQDSVLENTLVTFGNRFTYTDNVGFFSFENAPPKFDKIVIQSNAYGVRERTLDNSEKCADYYINTNEIDLEEVIVNYIAPPIQKAKNGSFEFKVNRFPLSPGSINPDIFELLRLIPGINTPNEDNQLFVRGGTPDQNQILWNTIRLYQNNHANGGLASLNPYSIENVTLFVKGVPSTYGDHTSGLILLDNYTDQNASSVEASLGIGLLDADLVGSFQLKDKGQISVSARSSFNTVLSDNFTTNTFNKIQTSSSPNQVLSEQSIYYNDFNFSSRLNLKANTVLDLHSFYMEDQLGYELTQGNTNYNDLLETSSYGVGSRLTLSQKQWVNTFNSSFSSFDLHYNRDLIEFEEPNPEDDPDEEPDIEYRDLTQRDNSIQEVSLKTHHKTLAKERYFIHLGSDLIYRDVRFANQNTLNDQERLIDQNLSGFTFALFGSAKTAFSSKTNLELGLRYNYFETLAASRLEPRLNMAHQVSSQWSVNTSFEKKSQTIYQTNETIQNNTSRSNNLWTFAGDERYPLLKSTQLSFGITKKGNGTIFDLDLYKRNLDGITTNNFGYVDPNDNDFHLGESKILGVDLFLQKQWNHFNLWTNYSFQDNQNKFEDLKSGIWFNSNFLVKHLLTTGFNYQYKNWSIDANYTLRSGIPYSKPVGFELLNQSYRLVYDALNNAFLPSYQRLDASLSKRVELRGKFKVDFKVALKNLTNKRNVLERLYLLDQKTKTIKEIDRFAMIPFLNFGIRFLY